VRESGGLILRLKGVRFAEGQDSILPESYPLLGKVMRAARELPGAALTIEGHTDARGDEKKNLSLSTARAEAVHTYLQTNMDLSDRLVTTIGRGEAAPIATNDTEAGRAQNRRIDLIFDARTLLGE
jgi:OOP family OmpA-OmpF porin